MDASSPQNERKRGCLAGLARLVRGLLSLVLVAAAILIVARHFAVSRLDEEIRARIEATLQAHYPQYRVSVRYACRVGGAGIEMRGVSIADPMLAPEAAQLVTIEEVFAACATNLTDFVSKQLCVRQLTIRRPKVRALGADDGSWSVANLWPPPRFGGCPPRVVVEDGEIVVLVSPDAPRPLTAFRKIDLEAVPEASEGAAQAGALASTGPLVRVRGALVGDHFKRMGIDALLAPDEGRWTINGSVEGLEVSPELSAAAPAEIAARWKAAPSLHARAEFDFQATNVDCGDAPPRFTASGRVFDGRIADSRLPFPLRDLSAQFHCDGNGVQIDNLTARNGNASLHLVWDIRGLNENAPWTLRASAKRLPLDERLASALPDSVRQLWSRFSPAGLVNADLELQCDGSRWRPKLRLECLDVSLAYYEFPYRLRQARGVIQLNDDVLTLEDFQARAAGQVVRINGQIDGLTRHAAGWVEILLEEPIPLDENLISALDESQQQIVRSFDPDGMVTFWARFEKNDPNSPNLRRQMRIGLRRCSVLYKQFPYPLNRIRGTLELSDDTWTFRDLEGYNDSGYVTCQGGWTPKPGGGELTLDFVAKDVPLEDELRAALPPDLRWVWTGLRPRGVIDDLVVGLRCYGAADGLSVEVHAQKWPPAQNVEGRSLSVEPVWLPYRLENVTGKFDYRDGQVKLTGVRAVHGRAALEMNGRCGIAESGDWSVQLTRLTADGLRCDHELVAALPTRLAQAVAKLNLSGPINVDGQLSIAGNCQGKAPAASSWDLLFDIEDGGLNCGVQLDHIRGGVRLVGGYDEHGFRSHGELSIDSAVFHQAQLTQVRGPLWIDESQVVFGRGRQRDDHSGSRPFVTARVFDGDLALDAQVSLSEKPRFELWCTLSDGDLAQIAQDLMVPSKNLTGKAFGALELSGAVAGTHTWRGAGKIRLRDADIYELPLIVALLSLPSLRLPETTAFTTADIDFRIDGDHVYLDRIDFHGDAITLRGRGDMDFSRRINLEFYAMVGRDELNVPILRPVLGEASRQFLQIEVVGSLDRPEVRPTALPVLNEAWQQIFPEAARIESSPLREVLQRGRILPRR